jgi:hypothetical protein
MKFTLPPNLPDADARELEKACVLGGPDGMPQAGRVTVEPGLLTITRDTAESGCLRLPWRINGAGQIMCTTATLIEQPQSYQLLIELARGKVNQLRGQAADWMMGGLTMPQALNQQIHDATRAFARAVAHFPSDESLHQAENALSLACGAADELLHTYANQVFQFRQQRQSQLDTLLGLRLGPIIPTDPEASALVDTCNMISLAFPIAEISPTEGDFHWEDHDRFVEWARDLGVLLHGGPLIDFSPARLPPWLWLWQRDRGRIAKLLCEYTVEVLDRYRDITTWQLTAGTNLPDVLALTDDELLWVALQVADTAHRAAPDVEIVIGLSQPWGDYMAEEDRIYSPFIFADTLLRSGATVAAIDLEVVMGTTPRGSYCRDLLDFSRMLDLYSLLAVPLQVTLGYPATTELDSAADSEADVGAGTWRSDINPQAQSDWAAEFASLALAKPYVRAVQWVNFMDAQPHLFPNVGLIDAAGKPRLALQRIRRLREKYLK